MNLHLPLRRPADEKVEALRSAPSFSDLSDPDLALLARNLDWQRVPAGRVLVTAGEFNHTFWLIADGEVEFRDGDLVLHRGGTGTIVGGTSMLDRHEAPFTVVATTPLKVLVAGDAQFRAFRVREVELRLKAFGADLLREDLLLKTAG